MRNSESLMDEAKCVLDDTMERLTDNNVTDWGKIKTEVKDDWETLFGRKQREDR